MRVSSYIELQMLQLKAQLASDSQQSRRGIRIMSFILEAAVQRLSPNVPMNKSQPLSNVSRKIAKSERKFYRFVHPNDRPCLQMRSAEQHWFKPTALRDFCSLEIEVNAKLSDWLERVSKWEL